MDRESYNQMWSPGSQADEHHGSEEPDGLLVKTIATESPGAALDLGCGLGSNAIRLARQGWRVTAVDFSDVAIDRARARAEAAGVEVSFVVGDLRTWTPTFEFDLVSMFYLHLEPTDRGALLSRLAKAVKPGGAVLFVGHDSSDSEWIEGHLTGHDHGGHGGHGGHDHNHDHNHDKEWTDEEIEAFKAMLTSPDEIGEELAPLQLETAEVVRHAAHQHGEPSATTLVVARRQ